MGAVVLRIHTGRPLLWRLLISVLMVICLGGCQEHVRKRPFGTLRLGALSSLTDGERYYDDLGILLRRDAGGFYAMSTHCTYDLSSLRPVNENGQRHFVSEYTASRYSVDGEVLSGPAIAPLPYYRLEIKAWEPGGPLDTLYVDVGIERPRSWRLPVPPPSGGQVSTETSARESK